MNATKVVEYLIVKMKKSGLISYDKDFLHYAKITSTEVSPKQLSNYINRDGNIQNKLFLKNIEVHFDFPSNIWESNDERQKNLVEDAIKHKLYLQTLPCEDALNISSLILTELPCTEKQLIFLNDFSKLNNTRDEEEMIDKFLAIGLLEKKVENQEFLVRLVQLAYDRGLYQIIKEFILPKLHRNYHNILEVQKIEAHTYGSLGRYDNAKHILGILIDKNIIENINLRTSALSNHKRELLQSKEQIAEEKLYQLIQGYQDLHALKDIHSYYTGINLLYLVVLAQILFPENKRFNTINIQTIYESSKFSLANDATHNDYYVSMSGFEFQILLGRKGILEKIESFLDDNKPHISLVARTLRQMKLFIAATEENQNPTINLLKKTIELLESYSKFSKI